MNTAMQATEDDDFQVWPHEPEWLKVGDIRICACCGWVSFAKRAQP